MSVVWDKMLEPALQHAEKGMPQAAENFLRRLRSVPGYGMEHARWTHVSNVIEFYTGEGLAPSGFTADLLRAMDRADSENLARFALGFPDIALTVWTCKNVPGGTASLKEALREAERLDTPGGRAITGTPPSGSGPRGPWGGDSQLGPRLPRNWQEEHIAPAHWWTVQALWLPRGSGGRTRRESPTRRGRLPSPVTAVRPTALWMRPRPARLPTHRHRGRSYGSGDRPLRGEDHLRFQAGQPLR